ncbi:MAG: DUF5004 domain-containing protein [Chitinophagaceae bacterium]|nr:DUF5004 domain-containing protein [Chitinophagaceae bacterium]
MKRNLIILFTLFVGFAACKPDGLPGIGDPVNKLDLISGNWQLDKVVQVDLNAVKYNFPYKELDVTAVAPFNQFKLSFALNNGAPATFTTTPGNSPKFIPFASGNWQVDDKKIPQKIDLSSGPDTVKMQLGPSNGLQSGTLIIQLIKGDGVKSLLRYDYYFKKI